MRLSEKLEFYRFLDGPYASRRGDNFGVFRMPGTSGTKLLIIASPGDANENIPWEHVPVSTENRCPNWGEMCFVKALFWDDEDSVMQLHPPKSKWINNHPFCLPLWRITTAEIPLPPGIVVGFKILNL